MVLQTAACSAQFSCATTGRRNRSVSSHKLTGSPDVMIAAWVEIHRKGCDGDFVVYNTGVLQRAYIRRAQARLMIKTGVRVESDFFHKKGIIR